MPFRTVLTTRFVVPRIGENNFVGQKLPLTILADSECLFRLLVVPSTTTNKKLLFDIRAVRESYGRREISDFRWIRSGKNIADGLTELTPCRALGNFLKSSRIKIHLQ